MFAAVLFGCGLPKLAITLLLLYLWVGHTTYLREVRPLTGTDGPTSSGGSGATLHRDLPDRRLTTMALATLSFQHDEWYEGTRDGMPIYDGSASGFHSWIFRTEVKWTAAKKEDKASVMSKIIEGLMLRTSQKTLVSKTY